jgi:hypothetical protein
MECGPQRHGAGASELDWTGRFWLGLLLLGTERKRQSGSEALGVELAEKG